VAGDREKAEGLVSVRMRGGQDLGQMPLAALIARMQEEAERRGA
jgi:threonyl-tRNA synthetase